MSTAMPPPSYSKSCRERGPERFDVDLRFRHVLSRNGVLEKSQVKVIYLAFRNQSGFQFLEDVIALER